MHLTLPSRSGRSAFALLIALAGLTLGGAPAASGATTPQDWTVLVGSQTPNMAIQGQRFLPGDVTIDAGDTVTWQANGAEIHTVTFFDGGAPQTSLPPLNPTDPQQVTRQGTDTMDGTSYYNSGILTTGSSAGPLPVPVYSSYELTFPDAGTFTYYCLVHGMMMRGVVHVQPAGTAYPYSQTDVDAEAALLAHAVTADGQALWQRAREASSKHRVFTGADDGVAMVMRFAQPKVVVHKGDRVRFVNTMSMGAPHTVTFGEKPQGPALFAPSGDPTKYRGGNLNSGIIDPGSKFVVTFTKVGTFPYVCGLHDDMGMAGVVVVKP